MPPPTTMTSTALMEPQRPEPQRTQRPQRSRRSNEIFEHRDKRRRCVERLGAPQRRAALARVGDRLYVDVEEDLRVIAHEPDRHDEKSPGAGLRALPDQIAAARA